MATAAVVGDTGVKDIKGRTFGLPVDTEHKATACGPSTACLIKEPHMHSMRAAPHNDAPPVPLCSTSSAHVEIFCITAAP